VVGDFNGDGKSDIAAFYDFGNGDTQLFVFDGTSQGVTVPTSVWESGPQSWYWANTLQVTGDFNGDGKQDIAAFYDFGGCNTSLFIFYGNGNGTFSAPVTAWHGSWCWPSTKPVVGDFNGDGKSDIAAFYDFGNNDTQLFVFDGTSTGFAAPVSVWNSGAGGWNWANTIQLTGDYNGDGKQDVAVLYAFGTCNTSVFIFYGNGNGTFTAPTTAAWNGAFCMASAKPTVGDFNGDGKSDIAAFYDFGNNDTQLFTFDGTASGVTAPTSVWDSGAGGWNWANTLVP
jgi:serralysin